jgi:hypothetical protein
MVVGRITDPLVRTKHRELVSLGQSLKAEGQHRPIAVWKDGTLVSGSRRLRAHLLAGANFIQGVYVDTLEDAAKQLLLDNEDDYPAVPLLPSELCRLWAVLRRLDAPAAAVRSHENRVQGADLRRLTQQGRRPPGRRGKKTEDYFLSTVAHPCGVSPTTAKRLWKIHTLATGDDVRADAAQAALQAIDAGSSTIWANYRHLCSGRTDPVIRAIPAAPVQPEAARVQRTAWDRALPQLEGLVGGLTGLGPPNAAVTWDEIGPFCSRLWGVRRNLEKIINKMRENQS